MLEQAAGAVEGNSITGRVRMTRAAAVWGGKRLRTDGMITRWADRLKMPDLVGDLVRQTVFAKREARPVTTCVVQTVNHQTHRHGKVQGMMSAAGTTPPPNNLFLMEGVPGQAVRAALAPRGP
jgi:hypothetical protein